MIHLRELIVKISVFSKGSKLKLKAAVGQGKIINLEGLTTALICESLTIKRGPEFRTSTMGKLNELKAKHPAINVYLNTTLATAKLHYYDYSFIENGSIW